MIHDNGDVLSSTSLGTIYGVFYSKYLALLTMPLWLHYLGQLASTVLSAAVTFLVIHLLKRILARRLPIEGSAPSRGVHTNRPRKAE